MKKFFRNLGIGLVGLVVVLGLVYALLPKGPRDPMQYNALTKTEKTLFVGDEYAAVTGTPWATQAALDVLAGGGTACDAAVNALLTLNVTHGEAASFPGVAPLIYYNAQSGQVKSYIGAGKAPMAASIEKFTARGYKTVPTMDIYAQLVPASPDVLTALLQECGTLPFSELAAPAIRLAREGLDPRHHGSQPEFLADRTDRLLHPAALQRAGLHQERMVAARPALRPLHPARPGRDPASPGRRRRPRP